LIFQPLSVAIGLRYLRAKRRNHFISFSSLISMLGIAVGVAILITVISVMNGFETEVRERILGMVSHATVSTWDRPFTEWPELVERARGHPEVVGAAPFVEQQTLLKGRDVAGALVRGIDPVLEPQVSDLGDQLLAVCLAGVDQDEDGQICGRSMKRFELRHALVGLKLQIKQDNVNVPGAELCQPVVHLLYLSNVVFARGQIQALVQTWRVGSTVRNEQNFNWM